jgi:hypothetical protein
MPGPIQGNSDWIGLDWVDSGQQDVLKVPKVILVFS